MTRSLRPLLALPLAVFVACAAAPSEEPDAGATPDAGTTPDAGEAPDAGAAPACTDALQNGDETGVDCGGSCDACVGVIDDFEGDGTGWTLTRATVAANTDFGGQALRLANVSDEEGCKSASAERTIRLPNAPTAITYRIASDITTDTPSFGQFWFTVGGQLALPALPVTGVRADKFCVPEALRGGEHTIQFVLRSMGYCTPDEGEFVTWIDDLALTADTTDCAEMEEPD